MTTFGGRLAAALAARGPLCLGIDPHPELLTSWGLTVDPAGLRAFCDVCVDAFAGFAVVKPQVAFFESHGAVGYATLEWVVAALREAGVLVLADAKRGDIGTTMAAYASAWVGESPLASDAVTASPYLGFGSLRPLLDTAARNGRGVFVLAATSNPEGASVQLADAEGRSVAQTVVDAAARENRLTGTGSVGVVVGATLSSTPSSSTPSSTTPSRVPDLSALGGPVLVPGLGAQGGRPDDLRGLGGAPDHALLPAVSREVLRAGPNVAALRSAGERMLESVAYLQR